MPEIHDRPQIYKQGPKYEYDDLIFYATNGVICIEDKRDHSTTYVSCAEFRRRAKDFHREATRIYMMPEEERRKMNDIHQKLTQLVGAMADIYRDAKEQGDPYDPETRKMIRQSRRKVMLMP